MALDPLELGIIALMGIAVFIWGPEKVPEIAKQIGAARKEINVYTKQLQGITKELQTSMNTGNLDNLGNVLTGVGAGTITAETVDGVSQTAAAAPSNPEMTPAVASPAPVLPLDQPTSPSTPSPVVKSGDELLIEMARKLGISTQGKTRDDIQNEILVRAAQSGDPQPDQTSTPVLATPPTAPVQSAA